MAVKWLKKRGLFLLPVQASRVLAGRTQKRELGPWLVATTGPPWWPEVWMLRPYPRGPWELAHLGDKGVFAQVQVPAEVTAVADDLGEHVGAAGVSELGLCRELADVHQAEQVPVQLVHLVCDVCVQGQDLRRTGTWQGWLPGPPCSLDCNTLSSSR